MQYKKQSQRKVVLNVYGGESVFHPDIVKILQECREKYKKYQDNWHLTITCTTNGIIGPNHWKKIVPLVDEFSVSYHTEILPKQRQQFLDNVLYLKQENKRFKCIIMMHSNPTYFDEAEKIVKFCQDHNLRFIKKPLDNSEKKWSYTSEQFNKLKTFWMSVVPSTNQDEYEKKLNSVGTSEEVLSINEGRPCCGGRKLSINNDLKSCVSFVEKQGFRDWYCSVNWFFLFVRQLDGAVFTNKDCKTSTTGRVEPLGNLKNYQSIIDKLKQQLDTRSVPIIQCVKDICMCGFCAPKADNIDDFRKLFDRQLDKEKYYG
jgi:hypothetical protein